MSATAMHARLGIKITYNINDSPQLRVARHPATPVTVYEDDDEDATTSKGASSSTASSKSYVGKFAELPLGICLSALKNASPELVSDAVYDYSIYVNDPTEASSSSSGAAVLVGKGLLSKSLSLDSKDLESTVFGIVVKDGIRGQSVLVHLVLEKTPRASHERQDPNAQHVPSTNEATSQSASSTSSSSNLTVNALLSLLSSAYATNQQPEHSQLLSTLASGLPPPTITTQPGSSVTAAIEIMDYVKVEDNDIETLAKSPAPPTNSTPSTFPPTKASAIDKENVAPKAFIPPSFHHPATTGKSPYGAFLQKSKSTSSLPAHMAKTSSIPPTYLNSASTSAALLPKTNLPLTQPSSPSVPQAHLSAPPRPSASLPPQASTAPPKKRGGGAMSKIRTAGPNGNGWYRRSQLPLAPSSDAVAPATDPHPIPAVTKPEVKRSGGGQKRSSDADDGRAPKRSRPSKEPVESSPLRPSNHGRLPAVTMTSPIRKSLTITIKKAKLKQPAKTSPIPAGPKPAVNAVAVAVSQTQVHTVVQTGPKEDKSRLEKPLKPMKFLSLAQGRPFQRARSDSTRSLSVRSDSVGNIPLPLTPVERLPTESPSMLPVPTFVPVASPMDQEVTSPAVPTPSSDSFSEALTTPKSMNTVPPPRTPKKTPRSMDLDEDDEGDSSPLFLPTPQQSKPVARTTPPTPTRRRVSSGGKDVGTLALLFSGEEDDVEMTSPPTLDEIVASTAPLDYNALGLPPSSPPSSFASSSPSVSPRFTLDAVQVDGEDEGMSTQEGSPPVNDAPLGAVDHKQQPLLGTSSPPSSSAIHTSDMIPDLESLAGMLGLVGGTQLEKPHHLPQEFDFWSEFGFANEEQPQPTPAIGILHGSDIFDFNAAACDDELAGGFSADEDFESLLQAL